MSRNIRSGFKKSMISMITIVLLFLIIVTVFPVNAIRVKIEKLDKSGYVTHLNSNEYIYIDTDYVQKQGEFRGVWVTPLVGDIDTYSSKSQYQNEINSVLDNMEKYNLNILIYHVRIMNDALYKSRYNKWSVYYNTDPDWEALPWIIEECHKRGIEFHAWMNPYRVMNGTASSLVELSKKFDSNNMASNPNNLLQGANSVILNPGIPEVKDWLIRVCMEVVENYDIDAIHFDDYFYDHKVDDASTRALYNTQNLSLGDFRRKQVDDFIQNLSASIRSYNKRSGKRVQLGISPSGVWRSDRTNGGLVTYDDKGNAITSGSLTTTTYEHYGDYLYSDTLKWVNNEWIDYILPQCYWSIEHPMCPFADLLEWWNNVAKYKKVNVYAGIGLGDYGQAAKYSWMSDYEAYNELMLVNSFENVQGSAFFSYKTYKRGLGSGSRMLTNVSNIWEKRSISPEIRNCERIVPSTVSDLKIYNNDKGYLLDFNAADNGKFYVIYRSENPITYSPDEVIDVIGNVRNNENKIEYVDVNVSNQNGKKYYYGVRAQSNSMTLGDGVSVLTDDANESKKAYLGDINVGLLNNLVKGGKTQVCFNKLNYSSGSPIKYALEYSFDEEVVKRTENYNYSNNLYYFEISVPLEFTLFKCKVIAYNDIGQSSSEFEVNSEFDLGPIKNFGIIGDIKPNGNVKFIWNVYDDKEVSYTIEFSRDGYTWKKYKDVLKSELSGIDFTNSINIRYDYKLNDYYGLQYFRICSNKDKYYGYSNVVMIDTNNCLSTISDLRINGKTTMASYDVNENDVFRMTWKMRSLDGKAVEDRVMWSDNGENWYVIRSYDSYANKSTNVMNDYQITISSMHYVVYIRIDSICGSYRGESQIIKLNVKKSYVFYDEIASYLNRQAKLSVSDFGLFN